MTFKRLKDFITHKMRMSHVYQPLLIRSLIDAGGSATLRQLAQSFVRRNVMLQSELDISRNLVNLYNFGRKCYENEPQEIFS